MKQWAIKYSSHLAEKIELRINAINEVVVPGTVISGMRLSGMKPPDAEAPNTEVPSVELPSVRVLDAFHAKGELWEAVAKKTDKLITVTGIEIDQTKKSSGFVIYGNNKKILSVIDLSIYDIIDLDAYTSPYEQIKAIHKNPTLRSDTIVIYTKIMNGMLFSKKLIEEIIPRAMIKKIPMHFGKFRDDAFYSFLNKLGIQVVCGYKFDDTMRKEYCYYRVPRKPEFTA